MKFYCIVLLLIVTSTIPTAGQHAVPPSPRPVTVTLKDGSQIQLIGRGSEHVHWTETTDGYTVVKNNEGFYEYAVKQNGKLLSSGLRAFDPSDRSLQQMRKLLAIPKNLAPGDDTDHRTAPLAPLSSSSSEIKAAVPASGKVRLLAICIDYPDLPHTLSGEHMSKLLNEGVDGKPSFRDYFLQNSYGELDLQVDVAGWVTASNNSQYYGDENGKWRTRQLVAEALQAVDPSVDFSQYDNDQDGDVDAIMIIHSGPGAEEGGLRQYIWSHRWTINSTYMDGKKIADYSIQPETRGSYYGGEVGIGIFCHEFGHLLGLPDLYDTDGSNGWSHGIGEWGLMGSGGWLGYEDYPAGLSAWSKEYLGWVSPKDIHGQFGDFSLRSADAYPDVIRIETGRSGEYFLLENRQKSGFDSYLNGHGLAVWHINEDKTSLYPNSNRVNGDENLKGVDLEEADGLYHLDAMSNRGDGGDLFPGSESVSSFDLFSIPSSDSYFYDEGTSFESGISLENIEEEGGVISFIHKRVYSNSGEDCNLPYIALEGTNNAEAAPHWFEFTMPREGSLRVSTQAAGLATHAKLYLSCDAGSPLQEAISFNDDRGYQELYVKYLPAGQKALLQWQTVEGEDTNPFSFEIQIEDDVNASDSLALVALYNNTDGPNWQKKQNWLQTPVSGWEGVQVENNRVVGLEFLDAGLNGELPDEFYALTALQTLIIENNLLKGTMDGRLADFVQLEQLRLQEPQLNVDFMNELSSLAQLTELHLKSVTVDEGLPADIGLLKQLEVLKIMDATLTGNIPPSLADASELREINFSSNRLNGSVPSEMGSLSRLQTFNADKNLLTGEVPSELFALPALKRLSLGDNLLTELPGNFFSSNTLAFINLSRNSLSGSVPATVNRTTDAPLHLDLSENELSGSLSAALETIQFSLLDLSQNSLSGQVPPLKVKNFLGLANNQFNQLTTLADVNGGNLILTAAHNQFTFDDLLPNAVYLQCGNCTTTSQRYSPQETLEQDTLLIIRETDPVNLTLPFDTELTTNDYQWYRNGQPLAEQTGSSLSLSEFSSQQEGEYSCQVSNSGLPGLVLLVNNIHLELKPKQTQQITVAAINSLNYESPDFELEASSDSGLPLTFNLVRGAVILEGKQVKVQGTGEVVIKAVQSGNADYLPAEKEFTFNIAKAEQQISAAQIEDKVFGDKPVGLSAEASSGLPVSMSIKKGQAEFSGQMLSLQGAGTVEIEISQSGNENYQAAPPVILSFEVAKAEQQISAAQIEDKVFGDEPVGLSAEASSGLPVSMSIKKGQAELSGQMLSLQGAGTVEIEISQSGNENYQAAPPVILSFEVAKAEQQISWEEVPDQVYGTQPLLLNPVSSAGLPVSLEVVEGAATLEGQQLTINSAGAVLLRATQPGDNNYKAALPKEQSIAVAKAEQEISFEMISDQELGNEPLTLQATSDAQLLVNYRVVSGKARVESGNQLYLEDEGEVTVEAYQAGNGNYLAAQAVQRSFFVTKPEKLSQTITVASLPDTVAGSETLLLDWSSSSDLPVSVTVEGPGVLMGQELFFTASGIVRLSFEQNGNDTYAKAETIELEVHVSKIAQYISFAPLPDISISEESVSLSATSTSGLPVNFRVIQGDVSLRGNQLEPLGTGLVIVEAYEDGNDMYQSAEPVKLQFEVLPLELLSQTIEYRAIPDLVYSPEPLVLGFSASSGLPLNIIVSGPVNLQGNTLSMQSTGTVTIQVYQRGNEDYAASDTVHLSFEVLPASQSISFEAVAISETSYQLEASASSGLPVAYEIVSGEAEIEGNILRMKGTESVVVRAQQAGDNRYTAADPISLTLVNSRITSIEDVKTYALKVYPNPSSDIFFLQNTAFEEVTQVLLYDSRGALLEKWTDISKLSAIDLSQRDQGVYQLMISSGEQIKVLRLIKK